MGREGDSTMNRSISIQEPGANLCRIIFKISNIDLLVCILFGHSKIVFPKIYLFESSLKSENMFVVLLLRKNRSHQEVNFFPHLLIPYIPFFFIIFLPQPLNLPKTMRGSWSNHRIMLIPV